eukprot:6800980-Heterocapsa_arctica.AAC.1
MHASPSTSGAHLKDVLLEGLHVQCGGERVEEEVALSQLAAGDFSVCLVDREDSKLAVPGRDL